MHLQVFSGRWTPRRLSTKSASSIASISFRFRGPLKIEFFNLHRGDFIIKRFLEILLTHASFSFILLEVFFEKRHFDSISNKREWMELIIGVLWKFFGQKRNGGYLEYSAEAKNRALDDFAF